jgi:hypothetical protein
MNKLFSFSVIAGIILFIVHLVRKSMPEKYEPGAYTR